MHAQFPFRRDNKAANPTDYIFCCKETYDCLYQCNTTRTAQTNEQNSCMCAWHKLANI